LQAFTPGLPTKAIKQDPVRKGLAHGEPQPQKIVTIRAIFDFFWFFGVFFVFGVDTGTGIV
jgi:hypothetical protein